MKIIMNGDVYIKRNPDYVEYTFKELEQNSMLIDMRISELENRCEVIENIKNDNLGEDWWNDSIIPNCLESTYRIIENLKQKKLDMTEKGKPIYDGYYNFWVLVLTYDGIKMVEQSSEKGLIKNYKTVEDMEKEFISLKEFLETSNFDGSEFTIGLRLPNNICVSMYVGNEGKPGPILTYELNNSGIIYIPEETDINDVVKKPGYELVNVDDFVSNTSAIKKQSHGELNDPTEQHQRIYKQVHDNIK